MRVVAVRVQLTSRLDPELAHELEVPAGRRLLQRAGLDEPPDGHRSLVHRQRRDFFDGADVHSSPPAGKALGYRDGGDVHVPGGGLRGGARAGAHQLSDLHAVDPGERSGSRLGDAARAGRAHPVPQLTGRRTSGCATRVAAASSASPTEPCWRSSSHRETPTSSTRRASRPSGFTTSRTPARRGPASRQSSCSLRLGDSGVEEPLAGLTEIARRAGRHLSRSRRRDLAGGRLPPDRSAGRIRSC